MRSSIIAATVLIVFVGLAQAGIRADLSGDTVVDFATTMDMPFMNVGDVGNAGELSGTSHGPDGIVGGVDYAYNIGKFEVTAGQYTEFLNAVADTDTYGLYNTDMGDPLGWFGCNIQRTGSSGSYTYSVATDWEDRPVNWVSWGDSARFANWLTNGMPTGVQGAATTEDGSYDLSGTQAYYDADGGIPAQGTPDYDALRQALMAVTREADARYVIPTEHEWYKAAYYDGDSGVYYDYPMGWDSTPSNDVIDPDPGNSANFYGTPDGGIKWATGHPYYRTEVGEFENSDSPYGTFDMGGNVQEWNEGIPSESWLSRGRRGGDYSVIDDNMHASYRGTGNPADEHLARGFRLGEVPEPATLLIMAAAGLPLLLKRKRKSRA